MLEHFFLWMMKYFPTHQFIFYAYSSSLSKLGPQLHSHRRNAAMICLDFARAFSQVKGNSLLTHIRNVVPNFMIIDVDIQLFVVFRHHIFYFLVERDINGEEEKERNSSRNNNVDRYSGIGDNDVIHSSLSIWFHSIEELPLNQSLLPTSSKPIRQSLYTLSQDSAQIASFFFHSAGASSGLWELSREQCYLVLILYSRTFRLLPFTTASTSQLEIREISPHSFAKSNRFSLFRYKC